jgi:hypothetical protein
MLLILHFAPRQENKTNTKEPFVAFCIILFRTLQNLCLLYPFNKFAFIISVSRIIIWKKGKKDFNHSSDLLFSLGAQHEEKLLFEKLFTTTRPTSAMKKLCSASSES